MKTLFNASIRVLAANFVKCSLQLCFLWAPSFGFLRWRIRHQLGITMKSIDVIFIISLQLFHLLKVSQPLIQCFLSWDPKRREELELWKHCSIHSYNIENVVMPMAISIFRVSLKSLIIQFSCLISLLKGQDTISILFGRRMKMAQGTISILFWASGPTSSTVPMFRSSYINFPGFSQLQIFIMPISGNGL